MHYYTHSDCLLHEMQPGHPERPDRLRSISQHLERSGLLSDVTVVQAAPLDPYLLHLAHQDDYLQRLAELSPNEGWVAVDPNTTMNPHSLRAARCAAGAVHQAVRDVLSGVDRHAFCAVRPPGHHAEANAAMGFCFYNSIAVGACTALSDLQRVAILDFDVHHGNGTVDIFKQRPDVLVCSSFQHPYYPYRHADTVAANIINTPLPAGTGSTAFRAAIERDWLPALERHAPQLILVSAGFDAHTEDPLARLELGDDDFRWITELIVSCANTFCDGRIVSALEGGYDLKALARSVHAHLEVLA
ncbi:MAG: histone deacetylase family protein [Pseudomonadales bacterium]|nr:histone deacetylase family protein [Pseudomonadales bacterium]MDP6471905.1 histone deacetylase family protein [Pseudomonadales bacterium]MDP6826825.1 histone deacetylase family protein [Pseudomonadales bacterium]MDP6970897.1 histone deacetylase family protein [Pseudomonadales bacterium]